MSASVGDALERIRLNAPQLVDFAKSLVGKRYCRQTFNCSHFIRRVYRKFGISTPAGVWIEPISDFDDPREIGKLILLVHRRYKSKHMAIYIGENQVVHNTLYLGGKVVITSLEDLFKVYSLC